MPVEAKNLKKHPGLNPAYFAGMRQRKSVQIMNKRADAGIALMPKITVPPQPNKYIPHCSAKEAAKYSARRSL